MWFLRCRQVNMNKHSNFSFYFDLIFSKNLRPPLKTFGFHNPPPPRNCHTRMYCYIENYVLSIRKILSTKIKKTITIIPVFDNKSSNRFGVRNFRVDSFPFHRQHTGTCAFIATIASFDSIVFYVCKFCSSIGSSGYNF